MRCCFLVYRDDWSGAFSRSSYGDYLPVSNEMIKDHTILCFASGYDAPPTSKHHVMHLLSEHNTVLWINYHGSRVPSASTSDMIYLCKKLVQVFHGCYNPRKNLYVLTPLIVPLPGKSWAMRLNKLMLTRQIKHALRKIRTGPLQVWSFTPDISYLLDSFQAEKVLYYCVDEHSAFTGYDSEQVLNDEKDLCRRADLVVTTSMALQAAKKSLNPDTILVPHGVDFDHFSKAVSDTLPIPADMAEIPHPRLGFFGLIRDWIDLDLLAEVARGKPDWHIIMLGGSAVDLEPYVTIKNLHFLGPRPYDSLPAYCKGFDVGLIPFKINKLTQAVNPIKLREYLAAGLPVVSTPLPEVKLYNHLVRVADAPGAFISAVASCLTKDSTAKQHRCRSMAREKWSVKVATICDYLEGCRSSGKGKAL